MLELFVINYGYWALALGTLVGIDIVLVIGGFLAFEGYLHLSLVLLVSIVANVVIDTVHYFIGRNVGKKFIDRHWPENERISRIRSLVRRHENWAITLFRFFFGFRLITLFMFGASHIPFWKFTIFNIIGAIIWASVFVLGGYFFGTAMATLIHNVKHYEHQIIIWAVVLGLIAWAGTALLAYQRRRKKAKNESLIDELNQPLF